MKTLIVELVDVVSGKKTRVPFLDSGEAKDFMWWAAKEKYQVRYFSVEGTFDFNDHDEMDRSAEIYNDFTRSF